MADCLKCGKTSEYFFHVLEVQTLHVRDLNGEKRVQALGKVQDYAICTYCAEEHLNTIYNPQKKILKNCLAFGSILILGIVLTSVFFFRNGVLRLLGLAAIACGLLGIISTVQRETKRRKEYQALSKSEALAQAAWDCMLEAAPKKTDDSDLTYIPINEKSLKLKNGDLMILYDLLPGIAAKAYNLMHNIPEQ